MKNTSILIILIILVMLFIFMVKYKSNSYSTLDVDNFNTLSDCNDRYNYDQTNIQPRCKKKLLNCLINIDALYKKLKAYEYDNKRLKYYEIAYKLNL